MSIHTLTQSSDHYHVVRLDLFVYVTKLPFYVIICHNVIRKLSHGYLDIVQCK